MPKIFVSESITIDASSQKIHEFIGDFHSWASWSPWLIAEPDCKVTITEDGKSYQWEGSILGTGRMKITNEVQNESINIFFEFLKPFKSKAEVIFELSEQDGNTEVTWKMISSVPWFLFWMKKSMEVYTSNDYNRGLRLLKDFIEKGQLDSKLEFIGFEELEETKIIGKRYQGTRAEFQKNIEKAFGDLFQYCTANCKDNIGQVGYTLYHKFDMLRGKVDYSVGLALKDIPENLDSGYFVQTIPKSKVYSVIHIGTYNHLENAWSAVMMHQNAKKFKPKRKLPSLEIYLNNPSNTPEKDIRTKISVPAK